jgi:hypothetical protein
MDWVAKTYSGGVDRVVGDLTALVIDMLLMYGGARAAAFRNSKYIHSWKQIENETMVALCYPATSARRCRARYKAPFSHS